MNQKLKSGWFAAAAGFTFIIAAVLIVLLIKMLSLDSEQPEIGADLTPVIEQITSDADVSGSDVSGSDVSGSDVSASDAEPSRKALDIGEMTSAFGMTRAVMVGRYGDGYTEESHGSDGSWQGYNYADKGVSFVFKAGDMSAADTVAWIECDNTVTVLGAYEGMTMEEIAAAWGWTGDWMIENRDAKHRMYIEKEINSIKVKAATDWLDENQAPSFVAITINK